MAEKADQIRKAAAMPDTGSTDAPPAKALTRAEKRDLSRNVILSTATQLFAERGFDGVRLDEIAEAAGVRRTLVLYYFASKEALWQAAGERVAQAFNNALHEKARAALEQEPNNPLLTSISASLDAYLEQPDYPRFLVREGGVAGPRLQWLIDRFAHIDVKYGSAEMQDLLKNTIVRDIFFAILLSMSALGPLMDAWLASVSGRKSSGVYPMSSSARDELVHVLTHLLSTIDAGVLARRSARKSRKEITVRRTQ